MALLYFGELYKHYKALNIFVMKVTLNQFYISKYASFRIFLSKQAKKN